MTPEEERIANEAWDYVKQHRTEIARRLTDPRIYLPETNPVSVFMAGSPGAGKTEASIELLKVLDANGMKMLRIDPDDLREQLPGYTGANAWLFQRAVSPIVERMLDLARQQNQSFVLDGTLASYKVAARNVEASLKRGRAVQILYVYQEPEQAWKFVQAREAAEGRRIQPDDFVRQYFAAREVVNSLKAKFGKAIHVDLLMKNNDGSHRFYKAGVDRIDNHIPEKYSAADVKRTLDLQ